MVSSPKENYDVRLDGGGYSGTEEIIVCFSAVSDNRARHPFPPARYARKKKYPLA